MFAAHLLKRIFIVLTFVSALRTYAFNPPTETLNDLTFEILGVEKEQMVTQPLTFKVKLTNKSPSNTQGQVKAWLNDDWHVDSPDQHELSVPAGESRTLEFNASAGLRTHKALYPVHATFTTTCGSLTLHPIAIFEAQTEPTGSHAEFSTVKLRKGILRLDGNTPRKVYVEHRGSINFLGVNFNGTDPHSRAFLAASTATRNNKTRRSITIHPPYIGGTGAIWTDYPLQLPVKEAATLSFHTSIRDSFPAEGKGSDGVEFKVIVIDSNGKNHEIFSRFSAAKVWEEAAVDLKDYAGECITLRLWAGPGPHGNTSCDSGYWGDPVIKCGEFNSSPPTPEQWSTRELTAVTYAKSALTTGANRASGCFLLHVRGETFGAAVVPGPQGLTDAVFALTDGAETLLYRGFEVDINHAPVGAVDMGTPVTEVEYRRLPDKLYVTHTVSTQSGTIKARATISEDQGALRIAWDMPDTHRDNRGTPRYTRLAIGSCKATLKRVYVGFGNVIESPESFSMRANGFAVSTRHVGADYANGLSLLQASTVFPDRAVYDKATGRFSLETPHDTHFLFVPSAKGAFTAARAYRDVCGFKRSPGWKRTAGKMCLDQWGGDYAKAAEGLTQAGKYGLNNSIFVKHVWQRWGYDYRLPEIFPPQGNYDDFMAMRQAAKNAGIIFAPHDNYIDFYPDAADYSYDHIIFNVDNTPQKAWYNKGRQALSYRWLPHAFQPWMKGNMRAMRDAFQPDGLFIDVFTAIAPLDYYDRDGNFYPRTRTAKLWGNAFDTCRSILKQGSPMICEAGHDALIGSVDAGQADHCHALRFMGDSKFKKGVRTPWHDMASHGSMILLAGGLGHRYGDMDGSQQVHPLHNYASDDYLSNTIIGGRNPMCSGPFSRNAVMTYWLLHDICAELAHEDFESHAFGSSIMQQHTTFGKQGKVWSNRGDEVWKVAGKRSLPKYGFYAENGETHAGIITINGQRAAFAQSKKSVFVDARPLYENMNAPKLRADVTEGKYLGNDQFSFTVQWTVFEPGIPNCKPFMHFDPVDENLDKGDNIAFQSTLNFPIEKLDQKGSFECTTIFHVPQSVKSGDYAIRFGLYNPERIKIVGNTAGQRAKGGIISVSLENGRITSGTYEKEEIEKEADLNLLSEINSDGKMVDFGSVKTDGAFRILFNSPKTWTLIPLPYGYKFTASLNLQKLGAKRAAVKRVTVVDPLDASDSGMTWEQDDKTLKISANSRAFGYTIEFE